jgi:hypothetical protein
VGQIALEAELSQADSEGRMQDRADAFPVCSAKLVAGDEILLATVITDLVGIGHAPGLQSFRYCPREFRQSAKIESCRCCCRVGLALSCHRSLHRC